MRIQKQSNLKLKIAIVVVGIATLGLLIYATYAQSHELWPFSTKSSSTNESPRETNSVDYSGPTEEDTKHSQDAKEKLLNGNGAKQDNQPGSDTAGKKTAAVTVSFAEIYNDNLEIRAFTPSVIEGSGMCTVTLTKQGASTITKTTQAFIDSSSSICQPFYIPKSQLSNGSWNLNVSYTSSQYQGSSGQMEVEVK